MSQHKRALQALAFVLFPLCRRNTGGNSEVEDVRRGRDPQLEWVQAQAAACGAGTGDGANKGAEAR
ncbi:MAG TPA: hypothetical protein GXX28_07535 [Firmicutes bacterium]|nr:hypothetical protein [Bacillota bacterium]